MRAVFYHADSHFAWGDKPGDIYKRLVRVFRDQCHANGLIVTHLTCQGHECWGDEVCYYTLDPKNIVANREECFTAFLKQAPEDVYWFTEPDSRIQQMFLPPEADLVMLYRPDDGVPLNPSFRVARPRALPVFEEALGLMRQDPRKDWHGDSVVWTEMHRRMGKPKVGKFKYNGVSVELWPFADYVKPGRFVRNLMGRSKLEET
jgi:hypothetical protein